jgi:hypothetical protein
VHLPKYYYRPILEKVQESYLENAKTEYNPGLDIESGVSLVVEADSEENAQQVCYGFIDVRMWELVNEDKQDIS